MTEIKIVESKWNKLSSKQRNDLLRMTERYGYMRDYARNGDCIIFTAYLPSRFGVKAGWAAYSLKHKYAMFFVKPLYRKLGIANKLMEKVIDFAKKKNSKIIVFPHDGKSAKFFVSWKSCPMISYGQMFDLSSKFSPGKHYYCSELAYQRAF